MRMSDGQLALFPLLFHAYTHPCGMYIVQHVQTVFVVRSSRYPHPGLTRPTVKMQGSPLDGRGFESFSEGPVLNGDTAAAYINDVQSKDLSIKHYVPNDQEFERYRCVDSYARNCPCDAGSLLAVHSIDRAYC